MPKSVMRIPWPFCELLVKKEWSRLALKISERWSPSCDIAPTHKVRLPTIQLADCPYTSYPLPLSCLGQAPATVEVKPIILLCAACKELFACVLVDRVLKCRVGRQRTRYCCYVVSAACCDARSGAVVTLAARWKQRWKFILMWTRSC